MNARFLTTNQKKKMLQEIKERFGIEVPGILLETGKEKIRAFSGSLSADDILDLADILRVEIVGMYLARQDFGLRLAFDATQVFRGTKNIVEISDEEKGLWMKGNMIERELEVGVYLIKNGDDFLGCGYSNGKRLFNYVPKERQVRN